MLASPWKKTLAAVGFSPLAVSTSVSAASEATPAEESCAPPVADELSQPRSGPPGGFAHGQAATPLTPGSQKEMPGCCGTQMFVMLVALADPASCASPNMSSIVRSTE